MEPGFEDAKVRRRFIQKVYMILGFQLLLTFGAILIVKYYYEEEAILFFVNHMYLMWVAVALSLVLTFIFACCSTIARKRPWNFIGLIVFTISFSYLMLAIAFGYDVQLIMYCMGATFGIFLIVSVSACIAKIDVTNWCCFAWILVLVLFGFGVASVFVYHHIFKIVYAAIGLCVYCFFLFYDTQLMLGGHHRIAFRPDDYVLAAMNLYIDIMEIFYMVLRLFKVIKKNDNNLTTR